MGVGCGGFNLNRIISNKPYESIGKIFKDNVIGQGRYHTNPQDLLSMDIASSNPLGFLTAGGERNGGVMSQISAAMGSSGQQSYGRLFPKLPKGFKF